MLKPSPVQPEQKKSSRTLQAIIQKVSTKRADAPDAAARELGAQKGDGARREPLFHPNLALGQT
jgi:hypothetical protein